MNTQTLKKVCTTLARVVTLSGRIPTQAALILAVLVALVPAQLLAQSAVPFVNAPLSPEAAVPGGAAFTLTVSGTGFASTAVVNWNGAALTTTFVSSSKLTAVVPVTSIATASTAVVTVTNPAPGGGTSNPVLFSVTKPLTGSYVARTDIPVNASSQAVATGDFRGVGKTDLAIANSSNSIDVRLGNGDGTFQTAVNYPFVSGFPVAIVAGDFNGDGKQDLAVVLEHTHQVAIMIGNGDGTFTMGQQFNTGSNPDAAAVADLNGDGKLDLVTTNFSDGTVSVLLGNGDGTFQLQQTYGTGVKPVSVAVGDFNGDGLLDLAVANSNDSTVSILLGAGAGTFATHVDYPTAGNPTSVAVGDFNGDGKLDLGLATASGNASVLLGNGDGTFAAHKEYKIGRNAQYAIAVDMNGDGKLDLATANFNDNSVSVLIGAGDGTFKGQEVFPTNSGPVWLAAGDFNRDGGMDLAVVDSGEVSLLLQTSLLLSPGNVGFPSTQGGFTASALTVTLRNSGTATVTFTGAPTIIGPNAGDFAISATTCTTTLAAGAACTYSLTFTPQDMGTRLAQMIFTESNGSTVGLGLSGICTIRVAIEPDPHTFPTTLLGTQSAPFTATFKNFSKLNVALTVPPFFELTGLDTQDYFIENQTCPDVVGPLATCTMQVVFKPTQVGSRTAALTIFGHFSPGNGQQAILMSGISTAVTVSPLSLTFGLHNVGVKSGVKTVTVANANTVALPVTVSIQGTNFKDFAIASNTCGSSIPASSSCTIGVTFTAQATGARSATLNIGDPDPTGPQIVTLTGTGQ